MPFKKGETANRNGRPPAAKALTESLRLYLARTNESDPNRRTFRECVIDKLVAMAISGNVLAAKEIFERTEGKVPAPVQVETKEPVKIEVVHIGGNLIVNNGQVPTAIAAKAITAIELS